jgi:hypothetical protein
MRRALLIAALGVLLVVDIALVPLGLMLILLGNAFASTGHGGETVGPVLLGLAVSAIPISLTVVVGKALRSPRP